MFLGDAVDAKASIFQALAEAALFFWVEGREGRGGIFWCVGWIGGGVIEG